MKTVYRSAFEHGKNLSHYLINILLTLPSVQKYEKMRDKQNMKGIIKFVESRFRERYITPMDVCKDKKSGFTMMAVSCLMIETLYSFYHGLSNTKGQNGGEMFCCF